MLTSLAQSAARAARGELTQASLVLLAILNIIFFPVLWGDRTLMTSAYEAPSVYLTGAKPTPMTGLFLRTPDPGAPAWQFEPTMAFNGSEILDHLRFPRWNPYVAYGAPWAAGMLPQPAFPLALLPEVFPSPRIISWFLVLRLFAAGLFVFLFMRFFIPFSGSIVSAIAFMLTGYFVLFINIDHLSTEVLLPAVFWSFERMYRTSSSRGVVPAALVILLTIVSGLPESALLLLSFGYLYYIFRAVSERSVSITNALGRLISSNLFGFGMAAFLLLPFWEFLQNGFDTHRHLTSPAGLVSVSDPRGLLLYLVPLIFGPLGTPTLGRFAGASGLYGYFGLGPVVLATVAMLSLLRGKKGLRSPERGIALFFTFAVVLCLMKHFGSPLVNWIGWLPFFDLVHYPKYIQPLPAFGLACLAGFGAVVVLSEKHVAEAYVSIGLVFATIIALFLAYRVPWYRGDVMYVHMMYLALIASIFVLFAWAALLINSHRPVLRRYFPALLILFVGSELEGNYILPVYYVVGRLVTKDRNPYAGAPFIDFLKSKRSDYYRVFGRGVLFPNWASVFQLFDVRYLSAVTYDRYLAFAKAFLDTSPPEMEELQNRFTGYPYPYRMLSPLEQRFLQLSSIRYLATAKPFINQESTLITQILEQDTPRASQELPSRSAFTLDGRTRDVLVQHPPGRRVSLVTTVPSDASFLRVSPAVDPTVNPGCDLTFQVELDDPARGGLQVELDDPARGGLQVLYQRNIGPKAQHWNDEFLDLKAYAGKQVHLLFSTSRTPAGVTACDRAGWGDLKFMSSPASKETLPGKALFRLVFHDAAEVYEYPYSLPRTAVFSRVVAVNSSQSALDAVRRPGFDPWRQVVVEASPSDVGVLAQQLPEVARAAHIESYDAERVSIQAQLDRPGVLLLTDSNYPGWKATVDGQPAPILKANYLFRGVMLGPGSHRVEFRYAPASYAAGYGISLLSACTLMTWRLFDSQRKRKRAESARPEPEQAHAQY
jgi:hypothetical protein